MRQFRVVLKGPSGETRRESGPVPEEPAAAPSAGALGAFSSCGPWFAPEPVRVRLARPVRGMAAPEWELDLVRSSRAAAVTLAAAGLLGGLASPALAAERPASPPCLETSSVRTFTPGDRPTPAVLPEAREVRTRNSFGFRPGAPLTDSRGNPILIAAYHSNVAGIPHTNSPYASHTNAPWTNHGNAPGGHSDSAWTNHANTPGGVHTNMVPGDYVF